MSRLVFTDLDLQNLARISQAAGIGVGMAPIDPGGGFAGISLGSSSGGIMDFYAGGNLRGRSFAGTGAMVFSAVGAATIMQFQTNGAERLRITEAGAWGLGGANFGTAGQVLASNGPGLPPTWQTVSGGGGGAGPTITLPHQATEPAAPPADNGLLYARKIGGRVMPRWKGPSGLDTALQPFFGRNRIGYAKPNGNGTVNNVFGIPFVTTGTSQTENVAPTNIYTAMPRLPFAVTTAATTAVAGWRMGANTLFRGAAGGKLGGFFTIFRFGRSTSAASNATLRGFTGLGSLVTAATDANPSTAEANAIGVGCDSTDVNYQIIHRNGTGVATKIDTGIPKGDALNTEMYELVLFCGPGDGEVYYQFTRLSDDLTVSGTITTNLPDATTLLGAKGWYSVGGTSAQIGYAHAGVYIESDY